MNGSLTPSYGRDYKNKKNALLDWQSGKDFTLNTPAGSSQINRTEAERGGLYSFQLRYKNLTQVMIIKYDEKKGVWK